MISITIFANSSIALSYVPDPERFDSILRESLLNQNKVVFCESLNSWSPSYYEVDRHSLVVERLIVSVYKLGMLSFHYE